MSNLLKVSMEPVLLSDGNDQADFEPFQSFPNPTSGVFSINTSESGELTLFDLSGKMVFQTNLTNTSISEFDLDLPPGVYIIRFDSKGKTTNSKLVITR